MQTELVKICPVCSGSAFEDFLISKDFTYSHESFPIVRCKNCELLITNPRPNSDHIGRYYESPAYISHAEKANSLFDRIYFVARKLALSNKFKLISQHIKQGSVLDYGCGTGEFLNYMTNRNWSGAGIEPAENARSKAALLNGMNPVTIHGNLESIQRTKFDIITLWHVLEHVQKPHELLLSLRALLSDHGFIFVAVPNHDSYDAHYYKEYWAGYDVPRHLWHFGKTQMLKLMERCELKLVEIVPMKMDAYYVSLLSEKYKNEETHNLTTPIKALYRGMISNTKAKKSLNYSSHIYIARHA